MNARPPVTRIIHKRMIKRFIMKAAKQQGWLASRAGGRTARLPPGAPWPALTRLRLPDKCGAATSHSHNVSEIQKSRETGATSQQSSTVQAAHGHTTNTHRAQTGPRPLARLAHALLLRPQSWLRTCRKAPATGPVTLAPTSRSSLLPPTTLAADTRSVFGRRSAHQTRGPAAR